MQDKAFANIFSKTNETRMNQYYKQYKFIYRQSIIIKIMFSKKASHK